MAIHLGSGKSRVETALEEPDDKVADLYTLRELMIHDAFYVPLLVNGRKVLGGALTTKLEGTISISWHVPGQPDVAYELPAQSPECQVQMCPSKNNDRLPQNVISMTYLLSSNTKTYVR